MKGLSEWCPKGEKGGKLGEQRPQEQTKKRKTKKRNRMGRPTQRRPTNRRRRQNTTEEDGGRTIQSRINLEQKGTETTRRNAKHRTGKREPGTPAAERTRSPETAPDLNRAETD